MRAIGELAAAEPNSITDGPFGSKLKTAHYTDSGPRVIRLANVGDGNFVDAKAHISEAHFAALQKHRVFPGDLVIAALGENPPRSCIVPESLGPAIVKADCIRFKPSSELLPNFANHALNSDFTRGQLRGIVHGVGRPRLNLKEIKAIEMPVPPLDEQQRIVAEIEKHFTRLEVAVAVLHRTRANLRSYRVAILKAAFEGSLGAQYTPRSTSEATAEFILGILAHRKQLGFGPENEKFQVADGEVLPSIPAGWAWCRLGQLSWSSGYGTSVKCSYDNPGPPILRIPNIANGRIDRGDLKFAATKEVLMGDWSVAPNDLLVIRTNGSRALIGRSAVLREFPEQPTGFASYLIRFRLAGPPILAQWVSAIWNAPFIRAWLEQRAATSAGQHNLSMTTLSQLPLPLPAPTEQEHLVAEIEHRLSVVDELERVVDANLHRAARLRQSILERAFSGRLVKSNVPDKAAGEIKERSPASRRHFLRAVLSAEIVHQLYAEPTFGQTKHLKIFHLCEHIAEIRDLDGEYHRDAAGPYDNRLIYGNEAELKKQKWYESYSRKKVGHGYRPLAKAGGHEKYLERYWPEKLETIRRLIRLMRRWDTEQCEIFSTAYAAWNDLLLWGQEASDDAIVHEVLHRWHENKQRISEARWRKALEWMRRKGFVPTGFGKATAAARS
jgi:type I restriction enzyme S subunit